MGGDELFIKIVARQMMRGDSSFSYDSNSSKLMGSRGLSLHSDFLIAALLAPDSRSTHPPPSGREDESSEKVWMQQVGCKLELKLA